MDEKPKHRTRQSPIDFVVPMQLEDCVHQIRQLKKQRKPLLFQITSHGEDRAKFMAMLQEEGRVVEARGTLRRWEGTSTRFEGTMNTVNIPDNVPANHYEKFSLLVILLAVLIGAVMLGSGEPLWLIFTVVLIITMIGVSLSVLIHRFQTRKHFIDVLKKALQS